MKYHGLCFTCRYWKGDKEKQQQYIDADDSGNCMDLHKGWPVTGTCGIEWEWGNIVISGDACAALEIDASFGCNYYASEVDE